MTDTDVRLPDTLVGQRAAWLLARAGASVPAPPTPQGGNDDDLLPDADATIARLARDLTGTRLVQVNVAGDGELYAIVERDQRRWSLHCTLEPGPEGRLAKVELERALPEGIEVRRAGLDDNDGILEVCRNTPIVLGDTKVTIDPGDDYFAALRLMDQAGSMIATYHGRVVAVQCGTAYEVRFAGRHQRMAQVLHTRVLPEFAGIGLFSILRNAMSNGQWLAGPVTPGGPRTAEQEDAMRRVARAHGAARDTTATGEGGRDAARKPLALNNCSYFAVENEAIRRGLTLPTWRCRPYRLVVPCPPARGDAGVPSAAIPSPGRPATEADASRIVELLNACHGREELFLEYTEAFLAARLARSPAYAWRNLLLSDHAVVGVWHAGQRRTIERGDEVERSVRSLVLDYGFLPGHDDELVTLLRQAAVDAARHGATHLSIFSSDPSPGSEALRAIADSAEVYELVTPMTPEPEDSLERGLYVDQIYF